MVDTASATVARKLSELMQSRGWSYGVLSEKTGISKAMLQRYATGETEKVPIKRVEQLAEAFGVPTNTLLGWDKRSIVDIPVLTKDELELLDLYRNATKDFRVEAKEMLRRHQKEKTRQPAGTD